MATSLEADMQAMIAELEAALADAPPEMRSVLEDQVALSRRALEQLAAARPAMAELGAHRPAPPLEMQRFFAPEPPAEVPAWIPDDLHRSQVVESMLLCPDEATVYVHDDAVGCAIPQDAGEVPVRHGLSLSFYRATGHLSSQRFYEGGLLRWSIDYHPSGGRSSVGFYVDREPRQYLEQGIVTSFAPSGTIVAQGVWLHGVRQGWSKLWEDDGRPIVATLYENDAPVEELRPDGARRSLR